MTIVEYEIQGNEFCIECKGHSGYAEFGRDIVCAGISTLIQSLVLHTKAAALIESGYCWLHGTGEDNTACAKMVITGLKALEKEYPEHLIVSDEGCPMKRKPDLF